MPITFANNLITVEFIVGDPKGGSSLNPYRLKDIYLASEDDGGWGVIKQNNYYYVPQRLNIVGQDTYFTINEEILEIVNPTAVTSVLVLNGQIIVSRASLISTTASTNRFYIASESTNKAVFTNVVCRDWNTIQPSYSHEFYNVQFLNVTNLYVSSAANYGIYDNILVKFGSYAIIPRYPFLSATRIRTENNTRGILTGYGSWKIYNFETQNNSHWDILIGASPSAGPSHPRRLCELIDPYFDLDKVGHLSGSGLTQGSTNICYTTFKINCVESNVDYILYAQNDEILDSGQFSQHLEKEIMFWKNEYDLVAGVITRNDTYIYFPFKLVLSKSGFQELTVDNITIDIGHPTVVAVQLIRNKLLISAVTITDCTAIGASDGKLEITAEGGDGSYTYSINGVDYQASNEFTGLVAGDYTVYVRDGEETVTDFAVTVSEPVPQKVYIKSNISGSVSTKRIGGGITKQRIGGRVAIKKL